MAKCFQELHKHSPVPFDVKYIVMDPGYSKENRDVIERNAKKLNIPIEIFESDILTMFLILKRIHVIYVQECEEVIYITMPRI